MSCILRRPKTLIFIFFWFLLALFLFFSSKTPPRRPRPPPRPPKMPPRRSRSTPRRFEDRPRRLQETSRRLLDGHDRLQDASKAAQEASKCPPRRARGALFALGRLLKNHQEISIFEIQLLMEKWQPNQHVEIRCLVRNFNFNGKAATKV